MKKKINNLLNELRKKRKSVIITSVIVVLSVLNIFSAIYLISAEFSLLDIRVKLLNQKNAESKREINRLVFEQEKSINIDRLITSSVSVSQIEGMGSGTVIKKTEKNMYILTCFHVIAMRPAVKKDNKGTKIEEDEEDMTELKTSPYIYVEYIKLNEERKIIGRVSYTAEVVKTDPAFDLALLKVNQIDNELTVAELAETEPRKGDRMIVIGNPLGTNRTVTVGTLMNYENIFYLFDGTLVWGNSGGGAYNALGELVGVPAQITIIPHPTLGIITMTSGMGKCVNLPTIKRFLQGVRYE